jgi:multicomponent Na+:H+ antiporter subunit E
MGAILARAAGFLGLWLALSGVNPSDLPAAVVAVGAATWVSLRLLPPEPRRLRPAALAGLVLRFLRQSIVGGVDVAWRAFHPRLPLRPGLVVYPVRLPRGPAQNAFATLAALVPGSTPVGPVEGGGLLIHCLDVDQFTVAQLAMEEALVARALGISMELRA